MKKLILLPLFVLGIAYHGQAQVITKFGDNVSTLNGIIKAYYDVMYVKKGGKASYERDSLLHWPNARVGAIEQSKTGKRAIKAMTLLEFHRATDPYLEKDGFFEQEISRRVEQFGGLYHVWSTYQSKNTPNGKVMSAALTALSCILTANVFGYSAGFTKAKAKAIRYQLNI